MRNLEELVGDAALFYSGSEPPLQQGDIVLAPIGRLQTDTEVIPRWESFDQVFSESLRIDPNLPELFACAGYGWAMVASHDCHLDREFNERVKELRKTEKLSLREAEQRAEDDPDLDRFVNLCPLLPASSYRADPAALARGDVIGAFAIPALPEHGVDDLVADLTYRATIDRHAIITRAGAMSDEVRAWFRFSLARSDTFRTPTVGFDLEEAVGKRIKAVARHSSNPLIVGLELSDGSTLELVNQPAEVQTGGTSRKRSPGSR